MIPTPLFAPVLAQEVLGMAKRARGGTEHGLTSIDMPPTGPCIRCGTTGYVRWERVVTGRLGFIDYFCGHCESTWHIMDEGERRARPRAEQARGTLYEDSPGIGNPFDQSR